MLGVTDGEFSCCGILRFVESYILNHDKIVMLEQCYKKLDHYASIC